MSSGSVRRVSRQDIQLVQNLIERCLQLYMNQKEVVDTLLDQAKIEPGFTELVWQKLEEENRDFFKAYYLRLMVKHQIMEFNSLLEQQVRLMRQVHSTGVASIPASNGSHISSLHQNSACYAPEHVGPALKAENMHHGVGSCLNTTFTNGGSSLHPSMHNAVEMSAHAGRIDAPSNVLSSQNTHISLMQGINGGIIKSEVGYSGNSPYIFGADNNVIEARPNVGDSSVAPFSSVDSNSQSLNESLLDADNASYGFLDIMEYPRSPFLATDAENFLDSREREHQVDNKRLDTISEGLSYEDFGSE
ncbi:uncharacterized protein LOC107433788 isoform X3 [Ziziphus jujuba]|uniref:Uncharacterized protein LOC107433788 isoform X3 n=1 Tax=Ziziphus jujuba TaxID=326968 RepID=A0ABM3ZWH7_ZIZJJ|nr:uncharacterized protein LOC107433788 isoform X3 [Ziziphus jujuba]